MLRAVAVFALLWAAVASKPPSPTPTETGQAKQEQARAAQGKPQANNQPAKNPPPAVHQANPEIAVRYEQDFGDQRKNASAWRDWPAWAVAVFTLGLLITAIFQWLAMHGQRKLMAGQLEEMKTTSADTGALAAAAQQQAQWAEVSTHALNNQADALTNQARIMLTHTEAAVMAAEAAKGSASAMLRQLEAYERPWLTVSFEGTNADYAYLGFFPDGRAYMTFYPVVKNIGKSLATNVSIRTSLIAVERNASPVAFIRQLPLRTFEPDSEEFTLFPGEDNDRLEITKHTPKEEIAAASFDYRSDIPDRFVIMAVVGVVLDDFANSDGTHHTEFAYLIQQRNSPSPIPQALTPGLPLSGKEITWVKLPGNHAD